MAEKMTNEEYEATVQQMFLLASLVRKLDTAGVLSRLGHADTAGAIFDPTAYRKAMPKLKIIRKVARGVAALQRELPSLEECIEADVHQARLEALGL